MNDRFDEFDLRVREALHAVEVPGDLRSRINARLSQNAANALESDGIDSSPEQDARGSDSVFKTVQSQLLPGSFASRRSSVLRIAVGTAAAVLIAAGFYIFTSQLTAKAVAQRCVDVIDSSITDEAWRDSDMDFDSVLPALTQLRWSAMRMKLDGELPAQRLGGLPGKTTMWRVQAVETQEELYVIRMDSRKPISDLSTALTPLIPSGSWSVAGMQEEGVAYFVLCRNSIGRYIRPTGSLA